MAKKNEVKDEEIKDEVKADAEVKEVKTKSTSATVEWNGMSRTYTKELHGEDFLDLAKEFAGKVGGEIK